MDSTALRAIQAASNGIQLLNSGFTVIRDVGNNGLYADTALRQAIDASLHGASLTTAAQEHPELQAALSQWGLAESGVKGAYDLMRG